MRHKSIRSTFTRICADRFYFGSTSKRMLCAFFAVTLFSVCQAVAQENTSQIDNLIQKLKSKDADVRSSAAHALGDIGVEAKQGVFDLIVALNDQDVRVRRYAANALGRLRADAKPAVPDLIVALKDQDVVVRVSAEKALESTQSKTENGFPPAE